MHKELSTGGVGELLGVQGVPVGIWVSLQERRRMWHEGILPDGVHAVARKTFTTRMVPSPSCGDPRLPQPQPS